MHLSGEHPGVNDSYIWGSIVTGLFIFEGISENELINIEIQSEWVLN